MDKTYSVVIPAFQAENFLSETIESVLNQSQPPESVVVVDDGSTDNTAAVAQTRFPMVTVISTDNHGPGSATATGILATKTPLVATLDADDVWLPNKMERQLDFLAAKNFLPDLVFCRLAPFGDTHLKSFAVEDSGFSRSSLLFKRTVFESVGPIVDFKHGYADMIDWIARAREAGMRLEMMEEVLGKRRIHKDSLSFRAGLGQRQDFLQAAKRALERKRGRVE